ncbi:MAG: DinB family protein [Candidatus Delongbacteria bacterium]
MSSELERLAEQLQLALEGDAWHGPSVLGGLDGVAAEQASSHPIPTAHSMWELVLHIRSDYTLILRRLAGDGRPFTPEEDWPACPPATAENWREAVEELRRLNLQLREAVLAFPAHRLDEPLVSEVPYSAYTQFIGVTQHNLYHAGQISLLKRALTTI